jgi:hypothetical protein
MKLYLERTVAGFEPTEVSAGESLKLPVGSIYQAQVSQVRPRPYAQQKRVFALLHLTFRNQQSYWDFDAFRRAVALAAGHSEKLLTLDGETVEVPRSLADLTEREFNRVYPLLLAVCAKLMHERGYYDVEAELKGMSIDELA